MRPTHGFIWLIATTISTGAFAVDPSTPHDVPRKTGNLSITSLRPGLLKGDKPALPDPLLRDPALIRFMGASGVEDYLTLDVIRPAKNRVNFEPHLANARACRELDLNYAIYPWIHFLPAWLEKSDRFVPYTNLETGETCRQPSGWAPQTMELVEEAYALMARHLGKYVDAVYITDVAEYGELGYPNGYTRWLREDPDAKVAWWCGDEHARNDFRRVMTKKYGDLVSLNEAWGTSFDHEQSITFPPMRWLESNADPRAIPPPLRRWLLDFISWYQDAASLRMQDYLRVAQRAFPDRPCEIKLGHGNEAAVMGHSPSSACLTLKDVPRLAIRSTHASVGYFHVKRVATPAHLCGIDFLTEPPGHVPPEKMAERIFTDACAGVSAYFDYPTNPKAAGDKFTANISLLDHSRAEARVALFFPEADHYLRIDATYPAGLLELAEAVRDVADYDVLDERLIADGALSHYRILLILAHPLIEETTFERMQMAVGSQRSIRVIQIAPSPMADPPGTFELVNGEKRTLGPASLRRMNEVYQRVLDEPAGDQSVTAVRQAYADLLRGTGMANDRIEALTARDGVWAGHFDHRILLYNRAAQPRSLLGRTIQPGSLHAIPEGP